MLDFVLGLWYRIFMSLPASKRQTATAIVFRSLFANQSAQIFLVFGTLNPPQIAPFSFTTVLGTFNNFTQFVSNSPTLNALNLIYGNLYLQYNIITQQPAISGSNDAILDTAIASALASITSMNTLVQAFTTSTINGASNQPDLTTLQTLVSNLVTALTAVTAANDDE